MIIVKAMGGLGNQLQQYALYKKLESMGKDVRLDVSWFEKPKTQDEILMKRTLELEYLEGISYLRAEPEEIRAVLGRLPEEREPIKDRLKRKLTRSADKLFVESDMYHEQIFEFDDKYLEGYWACEKYYAEILPELRKEISFPATADERFRAKNEAAVRLMEETASVSVHIRRGDYLTPENRAIFGSICTKDYYKAALESIKERIPGAKFFFFSDDTAYVRENYNEEGYEIIDWNNDENSLYDMMLMSRCKHNICANSTFSFWGARLNPNPDKIMIRPSIHKNTQVCVPEKMKELWRGWLLITPQGGVL